MIVDTSAVMALLLDEPDSEAIVRALLTAPVRRMSGGGWIELAAVITRHLDRERLLPRMDAFMTKFAIVIEPVSVEQARIGHAAYRHYGRGTGHPAALNFGDCFAYALAKETDEPLLFKGDDFGHTNIARALG